MKSPGVIYRRYRQLKRKFLYEKVVRARQISHCNCFYGRSIGHGSAGDPGFSWFNIFTYDYDPNKKEMVLCTCPKECNAFANKWTKEKVEVDFEKEMSDWKVKIERYPELVALEWVLDKDLTDAMKNPSPAGNLILNTIVLLEKLLKYINTRQKRV
jgi:hypothetical protein